MQLISKSQEHKGKQKYVGSHLITLSFQKIFQHMPNMQLPSWNTILLYKLKVTHFSRNSPPFNEPKVSSLCFYKWEQQHHILSHINSFCTFMPHFLQFQHNIIYPFMPLSSKQSPPPPPSFSKQYFVCISHHPTHASSFN
jgi:hypothetical protein